MRNLCMGVFAGIEYEELFPKVKALGFDGIFTKEEIACDTQRMQWAKKTADRLGLYYEASHSTIGGCKSIWSDVSEGDRYIEILKTNITNCEKFSVPILVIHIQPNFDENPIFEKGIKRLKTVVAFAKEHNVKIAFENINSAEYLFKTLDIFEESHVGFCYDGGHEFCYTPQTRFLSKIGNRLFCTHLHDNKGKTDKHLIPFDGKINFERIAEELNACGYTGNLTFELCYSHRLQNLYSTDEFLKRCYNGAVKFRKIYNVKAQFSTENRLTKN